MIRSLALLLAFTANAAADPASQVTVTGAQARGLTLGLKLAGISVVKGGGAIRYAVSKVTCTTTSGGVFDDGFDVSACQIGGKSLAATESAILADAISGAVAPIDLAAESGMSKTAFSVASISCAISGDTGVERYKCQVTLRGPHDVVITPKKLTPKDIVQPVKIEKQ